MASGAVALQGLLPRVLPTPSAQAALAQEVLEGFSTTGLGGGGGVNCIAIDPLGRLLAGGDNSGPKVSSDGRTWRPAMGGLPNTGTATSGCAAEWDPAVPDRVWLATQHLSGPGGGLFVSTDAGGRWSLVSDAPIIDPAANRPRLVGRLLAIAPDGATVYLGATDGAVWRCDGYTAAATDGTITKVAALGEAISSMMLDPTDATRLIVATRTRCWFVHGVDEAGALGAIAEPLTGVGAPARTEELAVVDLGGIPIVYGACWLEGVRRFDASQPSTGTWDVITPPGISTKWCAIDAVPEGTTAMVVAGNAAPATDPGGGFDPVSSASVHSVFLSGDADAPSPSWTPICSGAPDQGRLANEEGGAGGTPWWGYLPPAQGGQSDNRLGTKGFVPEQIRIDAADPRLVHVAGTQGVFRFERDTRTWYPNTSALGVTANNSVHCDPESPARVLVTNTDHVCFVSSDAMMTVRKNENPDAALPNNGFAAAFDTATSPSRVFLAVGEDSNRKGAIFYKENAGTFANWVSLGKPAGTDQRPLGLAVRRVSGQVIVLAAVERKGVYRRKFDTASPPRALSTWVRVNAVSMTTTQKTIAAPMRWRHDTVAYLFDHASGVWRSIDAGLSWQKIWAVKDNVVNQGYLDTDPDDPTGGTLYVSMGINGTRPGVWRLTGCQVSGATVENVRIGLTQLLRPGGAPFAGPGPVVARTGGAVWAVETTEPNLYRSDDHGGSWTPLADALFESGAKKISDMDIAADGTVFLTLKGPGVLRYTPPAAVD